METINQAMEIITQKRKNAQIGAVAYAAVLLVGILLMAFGGAYLGIGVGIGIAVCIVAVALYFLRTRPAILAYQDAINQATLQFGVAAPLEELSVHVKEGGMTRKEFMEMEFLPVAGNEKNLLFRNNFSGKKDGMTLTGSEITVSYSSVKNSRQLKFLSGTLLTARYEEQSRTGDWLMLRNTVLDAPEREKFLTENGYHKVEFTSDPVQHRYTLYTRSEAQEVPEWLLRRLVSLIGDMKVVAAIRLKEGFAAAYLYNRFYTFNAKLNELPNEDALTHNYLRERDDCWNLFKFWGEGDRE